jgi:hypothetical protein
MYQGESRMLDSPEDVCAGQTGFEYPATSVLFPNSAGLVFFDETALSLTQNLCRIWAPQATRRP